MIGFLMKAQGAGYPHGWTLKKAPQYLGDGVADINLPASWLFTKPLVS